MARRDHGTAASGLVSVVLSFRNEAEVLPELIRRLETVLAKESGDYELVFVNDDSNDGSFEVLTNARAKNPRIKIITTSRRFGQPECLMAGIEHARGDAVVFLDVDLQDPPEVIPEMLAKWRDGADVVYTIRKKREGENAFKMWLTNLAYRAINALSEIELPVNAGDFRLISRRICDELTKLRESDPYARGLIPWLGHRQEAVHYTREPRAAGVTHHSLLRSIVPYKVFIAGLTSFSMAPVYLILLVGVVATAVALLGLLLALLIGHDGWAWTMFLTFLWGSLMFALGVVGIYVTRVFKDVRQRPRYIVRDKIGFDD